MRIAMGIEYNGQRYHGWQIQKNPALPTIQAACERALSAIAHASIHVICAGRTDRGVHALGQVAHFETCVHRSLHAWVSGTNHFMPEDIRCIWATEVPESFHARYSATARCYQYILYQRRIKPALLTGRVTWLSTALDVAALRHGAQYLIGEHDFSAFRSTSCQAKTPNRQVMSITIEEDLPYIRIDITANAFLHHMVRNIVGVLIEIGYGKRPAIWAQEVLQGRQRTQAGITAPP